MSSGLTLIICAVAAAGGFALGYMLRDKLSGPFDIFR